MLGHTRKRVWPKKFWAAGICLMKNHFPALSE
jgi:hypothetical protein